MMTSEKSIRKDKNQNIQVFVRLRPLNKRERDIKSLGVVEVVNNREVVVRQSQQTTLTKKFTFDRAFSPHAKQVEVYHDVVSPLITEVLSGYNCTVFAYGQTGTGKTHTMVGEHTSDGTTWQDDPLSGIIPRALSQLFDELRISKMEHTVRVSYLELYNEELFDLLASSEDNSKLRIYEDVTRKGANIVNGLEEITVYNKNEVYKIMAQGQERKRVASTLMNAQSSRSHTVFTIVVHMKENSPEGEEFVKIGKLNLVDLAGSENISKAGSDNPAKRERARECVNINQSLLTLGRVITALVERQPHIPYRESKLTRILQESLGGRTKTSIIATISPGHKDLEETMSTLEYAYRAKNIQNKPEVNQKMTKKAILKEYSEEIDRLKRDLIATRDKNGVYLASETYTEMTLKQEEQKKEIGDLLLHKKAMEEERDKMLNVFNEISSKLEEREAMLDSTIKNLDFTKQKLDKTTNVLETTKQHFEEQKYLVSKHQETEEVLSGQAKQVLNTAQTATTHVKHLHDNVDRRRSIENRNLELTRAYRESSSQHRNHIENNAEKYVQTMAKVITDAIIQAESHKKESLDVQIDNKTRIEEVVKKIIEAANEMKSLTDESHEIMKQETKSKKDMLNNSLANHNAAIDGLIRSFVHSISQSISHAETADVEGRGKMENFIREWHKCNSERLSSVVSTFGDLSRISREINSNCVEQNQLRSKQVKSNVDNITDAAKKHMQAISEEKASMEHRLNSQLKSIEIEREQSLRRMDKYVEDERKAFEERINKYVKEQTEVLEERLAFKVKEIDDEKRMLEERLERYQQWYKEHEAMVQKEIEHNNMYVEQIQSEANKHNKDVDKVGSLFGQGTSAITIEMEALVQNIMVIVDHVNTNMMQTMKSAKDDVQNDSEKISKEVSNSVKNFSNSMDGIFKNIIKSTKESMEQFISNVETNNQSTIAALSTISSTSEGIISSENEHLSLQTEGLKSIEVESNEFKQRLLEDINKIANLESKYLKREYATYTPSGSTPCRQEFQFPRGFAATSPHERILARFRANRQIHDDDCIVVDSESSRPCSDSESSTSEDSAIVFVAPSPPEIKHLPVNKSTSEGDIFRKTQQGKENSDKTTSSTKKPSKLPAPSSLKKPLLERNVS